MIKFSCLDDIDFIKNDQQFLSFNKILDVENNFNTLTENRYDNVLYLISNKNKIIINFFSEETFFDYIYRFLHYLFFPMFFLNKKFDNVIFIFKEPKYLNNLHKDFFNFLFEVLTFNKIEYILINENIKTININNFFIYERPDITVPRLEALENEHNYYLPKQLISNIKKPINGKIIIPLANNNLSQSYIEDRLINLYSIDSKDIDKYNIEIIFLNEFTTFKDVLSYISDVSYVITIEDNDLLPFLLFSPIGTTFFVANNNTLNILSNYVSKICHSMFLNNIVVTDNLLEDLKCIV